MYELGLSRYLVCSEPECERRIQVQPQSAGMTHHQALGNDGRSLCCSITYCPPAVLTLRKRFGAMCLATNLHQVRDSR
jgi:hypothetical protein